MGKGSILLISYHFYPSLEVGAKRPSETALHLAARGYDVTVLRGRERRFDDRPDPESLDRLELITVTIPRRLITALWIRLKGMLPGRHSGSGSGGAFREAGAATEAGAGKLGVLGWCRRQFLAFDVLFQGNKRWLLLSVLRLWLHTRRRRYDLVIASGPPMVSYICGWAASHFGSPRLILDYRDPWYLHGDQELTTPILGHPLANFENRLANRCAMRCAKLIAASPGTRRHILERFDVDEANVIVVRNGFDDHARVDAPAVRGRLEMLYTGSLYWNRNPFPFLEALAELIESRSVDASKVGVTLVGNCARWKDVPLAPWIERHGMAGVVKILPFMDPVELRSIVAGSNVLINFAQGQPRQIPAKSYDYLAARRDVIVIAEPDGDVADLYREAGIGHIIAPGDSAGAREVIMRLYATHTAESDATNSADIDVEQYSRQAQLAELTRIVDGEVAGNRAHGRGTAK